jgi:lysophospholipase L1-like esterase
VKVSFFGDSLTEGFPGVAYFGLLKNKFPDHELLNYGKGGDTVISLLKRLEKLTFPEPFDIAFLWVGVNDVFVKTSWSYPIIKTLRRQPWAKNQEVFGNCYRKLLHFLLPKTKRLFTVSPLLIGEDLNNRWNRELEELGRIIAELSAKHESCIHIDLREIFISRIDSKSVSPYVPKSFLRILRDASAFKTSEAIAEEASRRDFQLTLDGIHLNGIGAALVADAFTGAIGEKPEE